MKNKLLSLIAACLVLLVLVGALGLVVLTRTGAGNPVAALREALEPAPRTAPEDTAVQLFDAVLAGDEAAASALLEEGSLSLPGNGSAAASLLTGSFGYSLDGPFTVEKRTATGTVSFTYADLTALEGLAAEPLYTTLQAQVENTPKSAIYAENNQYRPEVLNAAVEEVFAGLLADITPYLRTVTVELTAVYHDSAWHLTVPDSLRAALTGGTGDGSVPAADAAEQYLAALKSEAAATAPYIRKTYTLAENCTLAPEPIASAYGTTTDNAVIRQVIADAAELLDGQPTVWTPDVVLLDGYSYHYYRDDTILVITWKEMIDGKVCTCAEVKIADASQLMRKIVNDHFGDGAMYYCSDIADSVNAVFASNADFYLFRQMGIVVYQGVLYRCDMNHLDTCFFDRGGNMHLVRKGTFSSREEVEAYIAENDIQFSLAFGPALIEDGKAVYPDSYPVGQIDDCYSRSGMGMTGELHYFFMTVNFDLTVNVKTTTVAGITDFLLRKGCTIAYGLDGGQTAELYMDGAPLNYIDWNVERRVSDIIAFGTAIPESDR